MGTKVIVLISAALLCGTTSIKADVNRKNKFSSHSIVSYGVEKTSSTGTQNAKGSGVFLRGTLALKDHLKLGFQTSGLGGHNSQVEFYRLASGPSLSWGLTESTELNTSLGFYQENAEGHTETQNYSSRGSYLSLSWTRKFAVSNQFYTGFGGYLFYLNGRMIGGSKKSGLKQTGLNQGMQLSCNFSF